MKYHTKSSDYPMIYLIHAYCQTYLKNKNY